MSETFLENFLAAAKSITKADRGLAVDTKLQPVAMINLSQNDIDDPSFSDCAIQTLRRAIDSGEIVVTNNLIADNPSFAPETNTKLSGLRFVVAIPIQGAGAIYIDQRVRFGVIPQSTIDNLLRLVTHIQDNQLEDNTSETFCTIYEQLT
jgi:hypothetical protein